MFLKYFTQNVFYIIKYWKCLFNSIIVKSNFINGEKQWRKAKEQREEVKKNQDEEKEDREWKEWKNENNVKDGNEEDLERSNISGTVLYE